MEHILVVDDESLIRDNLKRILKEEKYHVSTAADGQSALSLLKKTDVDVVLLDLNLPDINGIDVLKSAKELDPDLMVIVITGYASVESAVDTLKLGAYDYIKKPFKADVIKLIVRLALEANKLKKQVGILKRKLSQPDDSGIVSESIQMKKIMNQVGEVAKHQDATVFVTGESGTGKEVVAKAIHNLSPRCDMPMMEVNCAALPENLLESELFGHEKGAFTDAVKRKKGLFEEAEGGTIFLDEIGEMPIQLQAKLLGVLERKKFRRIGGSREIKTDVRIISATNIDPKNAIKAKTFREDLYYRLNVFPIHLPPLRERPEDIAAFSRMFMFRYSKKFHKGFQEIDPETEKLLQLYPWPGNVRELKNIFERICIMHDNQVLKLVHLPHEFDYIDEDDQLQIDIPEDLFDIESVVQEVTAVLIKKAMKKSENNTAKAARMLGIPRGTLRYKLKKIDM